jgi:chromosome segregation ATPase
MTSFDLTILTTLKEKFDSLDHELKRKAALIESQNLNLGEIEEKMKALESDKMTVEMNRNTEMEELRQLQERYLETTTSYNQITESASQLLNLFDV